MRSFAVGSAAVGSSDSELNAESGFPELVTYLRRDIVGKAELLQRRSTASEEVWAWVGEW